ncbi:MAG: CHC2 zinc finger domain-containing protein [Bacteroidetes bacterium]|nr:CHC2 zinc finger domain-containing protein [Bacteroidota bacterium]
MDIPDIKSHLSIETVLAYYGLRADRNNRLLCPFHQDKTPSLQVYPPTNTWTCFSSNCDAGSGDAIEFIQKIDKLSKHDALLKATELAGAGKLPAAPVKPDGATMGTDLAGTFEKLKVNLFKNDKALAYLKERGLEGVECGYSTGKEMKGMKHCIVFPLKNKAGDVVSLYGRRILNNDTAKHYYSAKRQGLYPGYPSSEAKTLLLTEAVIDAANLMAMDNGQWIIDNENTGILACYGTNGLTGEHLEAVKSLSKLNEVIFCYCSGITTRN